MSSNSYGYTCCNVKFEDGFHARSVHRAVAYAFIGKPEEGQEVNHIDGVKANNCVENLEWCTKTENGQHEARVLQQRNGEKCNLHKLKDNEVLEIYERCKEGKLKYKDIAKFYDVSATEISRIALGTRWKHLELTPIKLVQGTNRLY